MDVIRFCAHAHTSTTVTGRFDREHGLEYNIMVYIIYIHIYIYIYIYMEDSRQYDEYKFL